MHHVYRQVTGLRRYRTVVVSASRQNVETFPFAPVLPGMAHLKSRRVDLLHVYFGHTAVGLLPFLRKWRKPSIVSFHGVDVQSRPHQPGYDEQMRLMLAEVTLVLARSRSLLKELEKWGCPPEKLRLNRTGIPLEGFPFRPRHLPEDGAWRLVQACRLIEKKGLPTTLRAFALFQASYPRARLSIAGQGPLGENLVDLTHQLGIAQAVDWRGFLSQIELAELYAGSHIFVHPSERTRDGNQEGVPNSMLEAMASGLPVVATQHGGIPEAVVHGRSGLLVAEGDHQALSQALLQVAENHQQRQLLAQQGCLAVQHGFAHPRSIQSLEACYDEARELYS